MLCNSKVFLNRNMEWVHWFHIANKQYMTIGNLNKQQLSATMHDLIKPIKQELQVPIIFCKFYIENVGFKVVCNVGENIVSIPPYRHPLSSQLCRRRNLEWWNQTGCTSRLAVQQPGTIFTYIWIHRSSISCYDMKYDSTKEYNVKKTKDEITGTKLKRYI